MLFTSLAFFLFLPATLAVYAILPAHQRWAWLLLASYGFYASTEPSKAFYLAAATAAVFGCGWAMANTRARPTRLAFLVLGLSIVLGSLFAFKFYDFLADEIERMATTADAGGSSFSLPRLGISTPVGFSFYAFAAASYLIDLYAGRLTAPRAPGATALYVAYFPKILAGPIERATTFLPQLEGGLRLDPVLAIAGLQLIGWGLVKKVVIADNLAPLVDRSFKIAAFATPVDLLFAAYLFAFQIYCDFSGYADIAIGISLLFGVRLMENFRRPCLARSTAEFWGERWHISLGRWFRDYLYFPLGGSRAGAIRRYANLMIVFIVSGLWHAGLGYGVGWSFVVWGALNGLYQWIGIATAGVWRGIGERLPRLAASRPIHVLRVIVTFHLILISWVFFRAASIDDAVTILRRIGTGLVQMPGLIGRYPFTGEHAMAAGLIGFLLIVEILDERRSIWQRLAAAPLAMRWTVYYMAIFALLLFGRWQQREFIYMQF